MTVAAISGTERRRKLPTSGAASSPSHGLVLAEIAGMIEAAGLQIGPGDRDFGNCCLRQNLGGNIVDRSIGDFMNEADVLVLAGCDARDIKIGRASCRERVCELV